MVSKIKFLAVSFLLILSALPAYSQEVADTMVVYFHKEKSVIDPSYKDNAVRGEEFFERFRAMQQVKGLMMVQVEAIGTASPEGDTLFNRLISDARQRAALKYLRANIDIPDSILVCKSIPEDWDMLIRLIEKDTCITAKEKVLDIVRTREEDVFDRLLEVDYSRPFWYIYHNLFPEVRVCRITYTVDLASLIDEPEIEDIEQLPIEDDIFADMEVSKTLPIHIRKPGYLSRLRIRTNGLAWLMGHSNAAVEIDLVRHLSVSIPFYFSGGVDYFKSTIKFRGIVFQPELRYYPWMSNRRNTGFFVGAHMGVGWYNFALDGDYRIQDHKGKRPSWGGGLSVGYRLTLDKFPRLGLDFSVGAGVYDSKYDMFYNEENGPYYKRGVRKTWVGIDNVAVSLYYDMLLRKKGGKK